MKNYNLSGEKIEKFNSVCFKENKLFYSEKSDNYKDVTVN